MTDEKPRVIIIPPKPELQQTAAVTKQLRVAAYCRVSTKEEEQASSYEAQCEYYTDKIMSNKEWTMAGIFADEGITGTSTKKRTEFLRMIRQCKQKKIDLILTKSIQRFARNTLDCINYTRILRQLGIGVLFEKENINSLPPDSEFMITMYGAMAQSESESISGNIRRGRQMHAKVGTLKVPCYRLYGYEKDTEGKFRVIPEQAEIVRELYKRYESGASLRNLQDWLEENQIKTVLGESKWTTTSIKSILTNEKYCGDVLLQKTFRTDVISKKVIKNVGQMAQYYMPDHHEGIVSREQYNAVKAEMAACAVGRDDLLADQAGIHALADLCDDACILMARGERRRQEGIAALVDLYVSAAGQRRLDLNLYLTGLGIVDLAVDDLHVHGAVDHGHSVFLFHDPSILPCYKIQRA